MPGIEFKLPELGENIDKGTVVSLLVKVGDAVKKDQPVLEVETEKAVVDVPSTVSGRIQELKVKAGDKVKPGQVILLVEGDGAAPKPTEAARATEPAPKPSEAKTAAAPAPSAPKPAELRHEPAEVRAAPAAPSVRRLARELGLEIGDIPGSGSGGRVSIEDVKAYAKRLLSRGPAAGAGAGPAAPPTLPDFSKWGPVERKPVSGVRRATAAQMARAWSQAPRVTHHDKTDVTELEEFRKKYSKAGGPKLTMTAIAIKIAAAALKKFPQFNSSYDASTEEMVFKKYVHVGVAVDTPHGLLVPVVRDADKKPLLSVASELSELAERARSRKLGPDEMHGGTFTITNLGGIGGTQFSPIVNWPEVAILGLSRGAIEPVFVNGAFAPRLMLPLSLSYDHRAIDGADAARFLRWVADAFQQPLLLSLED